MVKLRLRRQGRKGKPFYYIVAADARAPRDGRFIERIGSYNPNTNPATIDLNLDDAVRWLSKGAVPTDTCRAILSYKGAMYKHHLNKGVKKGALTQDQADAKFATWLVEKENKVSAKVEGLSKSAAEQSAAAHKREVEIKLEREKAIAEKLAPPVEETHEEEAVEVPTEASDENAPLEAVETVTEETTEEVVAEAEKTAEVTEESATEAVVEEVVPEAPAADTEAPASEEETSSEEKA